MNHMACKRVVLGLALVGFGCASHPNRSQPNADDVASISSEPQTPVPAASRVDLYTCKALSGGSRDSLRSDRVWNISAPDSAGNSIVRYWEPKMGTIFYRLGKDNLGEGNDGAKLSLSDSASNDLRSNALNKCPVPNTSAGTRTVTALIEDNSASSGLCLICEKK